VHAALLAELGGIILALGLLGRLAGRYGLSPTPLYLLAGLAFGHGGLLPLSASEEFIATGAEISVVLLLLPLGLGRPAGRDRRPRPVAGGRRARRPRRVLDRHRWARGRRRDRIPPRRPGHRLRPDPGHRRALGRPLRRAGRPAPGPPARARCRPGGPISATRAVLTFPGGGPV
jgi:hypothetical protein